MISKMKTNSRKRKTRADEDVGDLSLSEFMQKGFSSDEEQSTELKPKSKKKKPLDAPSKKAEATHVNGDAKKTKKPVAKKSQPPAKQTSKKSNSKPAPVEPESDEAESSDEESSEDDIEDMESDDEVIAKPRIESLKQIQDEEAAELEGIELSDDDDDEIADEDVEILTEKKLRIFLNKLKTKPDTSQIKQLTQMFAGAVSEAAGEQVKTKYSVKGQRLFNNVVLACLQDLLPAVHKIMKLPPPSIPKDGSKILDVSKGHSWKKLKNPMTLYMADLLKLMGCIAQEKLLLSLLRHILLLLPYVRSKPQIEKRFLKALSKLWATAEESARVVAFLCLIRLIRSGDDATFQEVLKQMYLSYVSNSKFTSPQTWPLISFMRRSLVEAYALRPNVAYQHSFLYIRQLAITLRTALTVKKKDSHKSVYNWQFIHSLLLWCHLLATLRTKAMEPLVYPVVQVATGVLNLIQGEKYVPLRLHVIRGLIELSTETGIFIPILPMLVSSLKLVHWNKKPKIVSMKPMNLSCALRVSDKQCKESAYRDAVLESFHEMALGYLTGVSHLLSFPEITVAAAVDLKKLKLRVVKHQTVIKQLLEKLNENARFIEKTRDQAGLALRELEKVAALELQIRGTTPLATYLEKYEKLREKRIREANQDNIIAEYNSDNEDKTSKKKNKNKDNVDGNGDEEDEIMNGMDDADDDDEADDGQSDGGKNLGKLDSDLDTEEEGDDEVGFEIADDDEDDDDE